MKFDCGKTPEEQTAERWAKRDAARAKRRQWHPVFAWFPKRVGSRDCRWLEVVERREDYNYWGAFWSYRARQS